MSMSSVFGLWTGLDIEFLDTGYPVSNAKAIFDTEQHPKEPQEPEIQEYPS
jgi:hypothetical protein